MRLSVSFAVPSFWTVGASAILLLCGIASAEESLEAPPMVPWTVSGPPAPHIPPSFPRGTFEQAAAERWNHSYATVVSGRVWVGAEILGWAMKGTDLPALVTTSPLGTPQDDAGQLGLSGTATLFGDSDIQNQLRLGGRIRGGFWWNPDHLSGFEGSYFGIDGQKVTYQAAGTGDLILARPYRDANTGDQASLLTAYPGVLDGAINVVADVEFSGAEALWRHVLWREGFQQFELFAGYRYMRLKDELQTSETLFSLGPASGFPADALITRSDLFDLTNQFHGGEVGLQGTWKGNYGLSLTALGKIAVGATGVRMDVSGETDVFEPDDDLVYVQTEEYAGGLLAQPTNIGRHETSEFASVAELGVAVEYEWSRDVRLQVGYTLIYWSQVARVANQVDTTVNPTQFTGGTLQGPARPAVEFSLDDFWAQGIRGGIEIDF